MLHSPFDTVKMQHENEKTGMVSPPKSGFLRASQYSNFEPIGETGVWVYEYSVTDETALEHQKLVVVDVEGTHEGSYGVRFETYIAEDGCPTTVLNLAEVLGIYEPEVGTFFGKISIRIMISASSFLIYVFKGKGIVSIIDVPQMVHQFRNWFDKDRGY